MLVIARCSLGRKQLPQVVCLLNQRTQDFSSSTLCPAWSRWTDAKILNQSGNSSAAYAKLRQALSKLMRQKRSGIAKVDGLSDSIFFPDNLHHSHPHVWKRKDFLQLFGDRSRGRRDAPWRVVFFGSDDFSLRVLKTLHASGLSLFTGEGLVEVLDVCTTSTVTDEKSENPVHKYAREHGLKIIEYPIPKTRPLEDYDVGLLASFGHLVPTRIIQSFPYGILNVHPSLLPRWRGASPCVHTILNGDTETGVTIMQVAPKHFDIGPIVLQEKFQMPLHTSMDHGQLRDWMAREGGRLLLDTLEGLPKLVHRGVEQSPSGITYAHKIEPQMGNVDWTSMTSEIHRQYLALHEMIGLWSLIGDLQVSLLDFEDVTATRIDTLVAEERPGKHFFHKKRKLLCLRCLDGWVAFANVKLRGKKTMTAAEFFNGYLHKPQYASLLFQSLPNNINSHIFLSRVRHTVQSVRRDDFETMTHGHDRDCLLRGSRRFISAL